MIQLKLDPAPVAGGAPGVPAINPTVNPDLAQNISTVMQKVIQAASPFAALAGPDGALAVTAAQALLLGYNALLPIIEDLKNKGLITDAQQASVLSAYNDIATNIDAKFAGPEWQIAK